MKTSAIFAFKNIRRYPLSSLGRSLLLFVLTFVVVLASMFSISIADSISDILNSRASGNTVVVSTDESELTNISKLSFIKEVAVYPSKIFSSGEIDIEDIGTFQISCNVIKARDINSLIPQTYVGEFNDISDDDLILAGRLPENDNEIIVDSKYIDSLQIYDYNQILGKKTSIYHRYFNDMVFDVSESTIVGVYSRSLLNITALNSIKDSACCFLLDGSLAYSGKLIAYCDLENISEAEVFLQKQYGATNVIRTTKTTIPFNELVNISSFIRNIMVLVCLVVCLVYTVVRIITVTNHLHEKEDFVSAIKAFGLKDKSLVFIFLFESLIISVIPFILSGVLSAVCTKGISRYVSILSGIGYGVKIRFLPFAIAFAIIFAINFFTIIVSVYSYKPAKNE